MSASPSMNSWLLVQLAVTTLLPLAAQLALVAVAAMWVRPHFPRGWLWLLAAGLLGLLEGVLSPVSSILIPLWVTRTGGASDIVVANAVSGIVRSVLHLGWWGLLLGGLVAMCRDHVLVLPSDR